MSDSEGKESSPKKGGRGCPKKAAEPRSESKDSSDEPKAKRGRGRPKGSTGTTKAKKVFKKEEKVMDNETVTEKKYDVVEKEEKDMDNETATEKKYEVQKPVVARSSVKKGSVIRDSVPKANFVTSKQKKEKWIDTDNTSGFGRNKRTYTRVKKIKHESVPESFKSVEHDENDEKIYTFKMRGKDELERVPFRNLTQKMRKMLRDFHDYELRSLLGLPVTKSYYRF